VPGGFLVVCVCAFHFSSHSSSGSNLNPYLNDVIPSDVMPSLQLAGWSSYRWTESGWLCWLCTRTPLQFEK